MSDKKFNKVIILLIILILVATGILGYYLFTQKKEVKEESTKEAPTEISKEIVEESSEQELADGIYIKKPSNWGEVVIKEKVEGVYTEEKISESGYSASCDFTRIKFKKFIQNDEDSQSYENSIFVAKLSDMKKFYEVMKKIEVSEFIENEREGGPFKIEGIYEKRKVEKSDLYFINKVKSDKKIIETSEVPEVDIWIKRRNAYPRFRDFGYIESEWKKLEKENIKVVTKDEKEYPPLLKEITNPPLLLYIKGEIYPEENYFSCVGTRWPSDYGKMVTSDIVGDLADFGFTIVSGLARGIDTLSHKITLEKEKRTVAVVGNGLDIVFPPENKNLAKKIEKNGAIISEFPLGTPPLPYNFPLRNRIIAGISKGILVIEAKEKSGALITANLALEEGREIFAIPGSIYSKNSAGCNKLIKEGAHLTTSINDIVSLFNLETEIKLEKEIKGKTKEENTIIDVLKKEPKTIEKIIKETKMPASTVNSLLILLEIEGKIKKTGEKYYINN